MRYSVVTDPSVSICPDKEETGEVSASLGECSLQRCLIQAHSFKSSGATSNTSKEFKKLEPTVSQLKNGWALGCKYKKSLVASAWPRPDEAPQASAYGHTVLGATGRRLPSGARQASSWPRNHTLSHFCQMFILLTGHSLCSVIQSKPIQFYLYLDETLS